MRSRLTREQRIGNDHAYWLTYKYDQGGNRTWKKQFDPEGDPIARTHYRYDTDEDAVDCDGDGSLDSSPADCYRTRHNRLMYYETEVWFEEGQTAEFRLAETVWYQYLTDTAATGNPDYIVRRVYNPEQPSQPPMNYAYALAYNSAGALWFITQSQWQSPSSSVQCPEGGPTVTARNEFRSFGRAMRLTRQRDPGNVYSVVPGTNVWHDYDGDEIYADTLYDYYQGSEFTVTPLAAHEPGIGSFDYAASAASYRHGDQIGSTRVITGEPDGGPAPLEGRIVYTAFGERVWSDGTIGTRYQYAGAWGYQSDLYDDASGNLPFVHVGHRWYDPATGRFLQRDPIGIDGGLNVYAYAEGNSVTNVDPYGLTHDVKFDRYFRERDRMKAEERRQLDIVTGVGVTCAAAPWAAIAAGPSIAALKVAAAAGAIKIGSDPACIRWGQGVISRAGESFQMGWRVAIGGPQGGWRFHIHIHKLNWNKPWLWNK